MLCGSLISQRTTCSVYFKKQNQLITVAGISKNQNQRTGRFWVSKTLKECWFSWKNHLLFPILWLLKLFFVLIPKVISVTSCKCVTRFKAAQHGFPRTGSAGPRANWHRNMSCFGGGLVLISASQKLHALEHEPRNLPPIKTCQVSTSSVTRISMPRQSEPPKPIPIKTCILSRAMFQPHVPIFHVSPYDPHPCPMTNPWCFRPFSTSHCCCVFFHQTLMSSSPFPRHRFT